MAGITGTLLGIAGNALLSGINNSLAGQRATEDRYQNYIYGERAADKADARTRELYNDLYSPAALLSQYNQAGLSPSLMFGGTPGQGGQSGAQGTGAHGIQTPYMPMSLLEAAQVANLMAQTDKTKAETEQVRPLSESTIAKNLADAGHADAAAAALKAQEAGTKLDNYVKEHTLDASIYTICELAEQQAHATMKMYHEMRSAKVMADIDEATFDIEVQKRSKELDLIIQNIRTSKSQERLNDQQVKDIKDQILARIEETKIKWKEVDIKEKQTTSYGEWIEAQIPYIEQQIELKLKELGIQKTRLWVDGISNIIKSIAIGAGAAAALKKPGTNIPTYSGSTMPELTIM